MLKKVILLYCFVLLYSCAAPQAQAEKDYAAEAQYLKSQSANFGQGSTQNTSSASGAERTLMPKLRSFSCKDPHALKGVATSTVEHEAVGQAQNQLALQIQASVEGLTDSYRSSERTGDQENITRTWTSQVRQIAHLSNAHEAKIEYLEKHGDMYGAVVCMSKDAAARPFWEQYASLADSLQIFINTVISQNHPLRKIQAWWESQQLYTRLLPINGVLDALGQHENAEKLKLQANYRAMVEHYTAFKSNFNMYWEGADDKFSQAIFSQLSSRYKISTGVCKQGVRLVLTKPEVQCNYGSFGYMCSWQPSLKGVACDGELYFTIDGELLRGIGKNEREAQGHLTEVIAKSSLWGQWYAELDQWGLR